MASSEDNKVEDPAKPREQLIGTAVKFLLNPKVRDSPFPQRKRFLKQKGLTDEEVQIAIDRSGTAGDEATHPAGTGQNQSQPVATGHQLVPAVQTVPVSRWSKIRDFTSTAILIGGVSYAVYMIFKHYLVPHLFKPSREEQQLEKLTQSVNQLQESVTSILQSIQDTQKTLTDQQDILKQAVVDTAAGRGSKEMVAMQNTQFVNEIKEEVKSLKGLMLSRRQFPVAPTTTPVLPAWQLQSNSQSETSTTETSQRGADPETNQSQGSVSEDAIKTSLVEESVSMGGDLETSQSQESGVASENNITENGTEMEGESGLTDQSLKPETMEAAGDRSTQDDKMSAVAGQLSQGFDKTSEVTQPQSPVLNGVAS